MSFQIDISKFRLKQEYFDHVSSIHGISHTYRVMCHTLYIGTAAGLNRETEIALSAAYIHDLARKHDGYCNQHGLWSVQDKLPLFTGFFGMMGITDEEIMIISEAVKNHSEANELDTVNKAYIVTALLKDADALDRIRLGDYNLDPTYLRFKESAGLIPFAKELFYRTININFSSFTEVLEIAKLIDLKTK
ncbi:MAG: HD domain-containing protein [Bacteroidales bacterium]|nr:HD domain-containing protein [Bacteroidales bacterium]